MGRVPDHAPGGPRPTAYWTPSPPASTSSQPRSPGSCDGRLEPTLEPAQVRALENELVRVYADLGDYFIEGLSSEDPDSAVTGVLAEEPNLLHVLECALSSGQWG